MPNLHKIDAEKVRIAGQKMSNWLFNLYQSDEFKKHKETMRELVAEWDAVAALLRK